MLGDRPLSAGLCEIFARSAAMRSANHGWRVLHSCGSSSRSTAAGWSATSAMSWIVALVTIDQLARRRRRPGRHRVGRVEQGVVVDAAVDQPDPLGLGAVEDLAEHDRGHRRLRPGDAAEHPRVAAAGVQADLQEAGVELGPPGGEAHVAAEGQVHARRRRRRR